MNSVLTFSFANRSIRVVVDVDGNCWFVGRDICLVCGLTNPNATMRNRWKTAVPTLMQIKDRMGRDSDVRVLTVGEAEDLIQRMEVPHSGFEFWFVNEVLPQLNARVTQPKTGDLT
jgi:prophage antirepressor-like protein